MARVSRPTLLHRIEYFATLFAGALLSPLPSVAALNFGALIGIVLGRVLPVRRQVIENNLEIAFGDDLAPEERKRIVRECYKTLAMTAVETLMLQHRSPKWVASRVSSIENEQALDELSEREGGFIGVTPHFGNWEILGAYWASQRPVSALAKPLHNPLMQDYVERTRARHGLNLIWTNCASPGRAILRALRTGRAVNIMPDQDMRQEGIFVDFFGRPASTTPAPALFAIRANCAILPAFIVRSGITSHRVVFGHPIHPSGYAEQGSEEEQVRAMTQAYTKAIEDMIRLYPTQYFWFHRRWKTTPEEVARKKEKRERRRRRRLEGLKTSPPQPSP